jgi:hypothetical protein
MEEENMKSKDTLDILSECISNLDDSSGKSTSAKSNSSLNNYEQKNDDEVNEESNALNDQNKDCIVINIIQEKNPGDDDGKIQSNDDIEKKEVEYENMEEEKYNLLFSEVDKEEEGDNNQKDEEEKEELMEEEKNNDKESLKSNTPCLNGFINVCNQCEKTPIFTNRDTTSSTQKNKDEQFNSKIISKKNSKEISHPNENINNYAYLSGLFNMENQELISNESLTKENDDIAPENMLSIIDNINSNSIHDSSDRATNCENEDLPPYDFIQIKETKSKTTQGKG